MVLGKGLEKKWGETEGNCLEEKGGESGPGY